MKIRTIIRGAALSLVWLAPFLASCRPAGTVTPIPGNMAQPPAATQAAQPSHQPGCTVKTRQPTPDATLQSVLPSPSERDWVKGPAEAYVTIIEYSDFQCPGCAGIAPVLAQLQKQYPQDIRIVYRHFPLNIHDKALLATQAAEAAGLQHKFWEMHDLLFARRAEWTGLEPAEFEQWLAGRAGELELDVEKFQQDLTSDALVKLAQDAYDRNAAVGMPGTPFLVINGYPYNGPLDKASLDATLQLVLLERRQYPDCPPMAIDASKQYYATLHTARGDIKIELYADKAPLAVNNFVFLARQGWFDGVTFHRVLPGFVAQAGDPSGSGFGGPGYAFDNEISPDLTFDGPGVVGMANAGPGSNGSQFFITFAAAPNLNGGYTIFGRVIEGMAVVQALTPRDPSQTLDLPSGDVILGVTIEEK